MITSIVITDSKGKEICFSSLQCKTYEIGNETFTIDFDEVIITQISDNWQNAENSIPIQVVQEKLRKVEKPPLGVMPKRHWLNNRLLELHRAINERINANMTINPEWIEEYNELKGLES